MQAALPGSEQGARYGRCKLTLEDGLFIKSHILPEALTRHDVRGEAIFQIGTSRRPTRRRTSWYDKQLVTLSGERILTSYDTWAIRQLRLHKLVWSGWGRQTLGGSVDGVDATGFGVRVIDGGDWQRLRLFFLSLLWRAAASDLPEFQEVRLPPEDLEQLRLMLVEANPEPADFYPIGLTQLSTRGPSHNVAPLAQDMVLPFNEGSGPATTPIFRFYLQGLIAHFHRPTGAPSPYSEGMCVGTEDRLLVLARPYDGSWEEENLNLNFAEAWAAWPQIRPHLNGVFDPNTPYPGTRDASEQTE